MATPNSLSMLCLEVFFLQIDALFPTFLVIKILPVLKDPTGIFDAQAF